MGRHAACGSMVWVIVVAWDRIFTQGALDFCNDASIGSTAQKMYRALVWREIRFRELGEKSTGKNLIDRAGRCERKTAGRKTKRPALQAGRGKRRGLSTGLPRLLVDLAR